MDWQTLTQLQPGLAHIPESLRAGAEFAELESGEVLFRTGGQVRSMICVVSGEVCLIRRSRNGTETVLQRSRGGFLAEASLNAKAYRCDAVATAKSAVLRLPVKSFRHALGTSTTFRDAWMMHLATEVHRLRAQCERLSLHGAADRVIHYIESEGTDGLITLAQSRKAWAAELGLTHEALYRTLSRLRADGTLRMNGKRIVLSRR